MQARGSLSPYSTSLILPQHPPGADTQLALSIRRSSVRLDKLARQRSSTATALCCCCCWIKLLAAAILTSSSICRCCHCCRRLAAAAGNTAAPACAPAAVRCSRSHAVAAARCCCPATTTHTDTACLCAFNGCQCGLQAVYCCCRGVCCHLQLIHTRLQGGDLVVWQSVGVCGWVCRWVGEERLQTG